MAKAKVREITIVNRNAPRVAIQITEISGDAKKDPPPPIGRAFDGDESLRRGREKNHYQGNRKGRRSIEAMGVDSEFAVDRDATQ